MTPEDVFRGHGLAGHLMLVSFGLGIAAAAMRKVPMQAKGEPIPPGDQVMTFEQAIAYAIEQTRADIMRGLACPVCGSTDKRTAVEGGGRRCPKCNTIIHP